MTYTLYIDESGDEGIQLKQIEKGASPLFILGAYLVYEDDKSIILENIEKSKARMNDIDIIHFSRLKHDQKVYFCKELSKMPIHIFALISDKSGLDRNNYREQAAKRNGDFYNTNVKYLLENVCEYCEKNKMEISKIIFEMQDNKNYTQLQNFIRSCQNRPFHPRSVYLRNIVAGNIFARSKNDEPLLQISDAISNSFFRLCVPHSLGHCEPRYVEEFECKIVSKLEGCESGNGVKVVPDVQNLNANDNVKRYLQTLNS